MVHEVSPTLAVTAFYSGKVAKYGIPLVCVPNFDASQLCTLFEFAKVYNYNCVKVILDYTRAKNNVIWMIIVTCGHLQSWRFELGNSGNLKEMIIYPL